MNEIENLTTCLANVARGHLALRKRVAKALADVKTAPKAKRMIALRYAGMICQDACHSDQFAHPEFRRPLGAMAQLCAFGDARGFIAMGDELLG